MDTVGDVSSFSTVFGLTVKTGTLLAKIYRRYENAEAYLGNLSNQLKVIESEPQLLLLFCGDELLNSLQLDTITMLTIKNSLEIAENGLKQVLEFCFTLDYETSSKYRRLIWSIKGDSKLQEMLSRLQNPESRLSTILQLIQM
jgi:hypothetical protein